MNSRHLVPFACLMLSVAWGASTAATVETPASPALQRGKHIDMTVVSVVSLDSGSFARPSAGQPVSYFACDAGYIEAGDSIAGLRPPSAASIANALRASLGAEGYKPASAPANPSLVLIYDWGMIARRRSSHTTLNRLDLNLRARLSLVATDPIVERIEDRLTLHSAGIYGDSHVRPSERDALDLARGTLYFVVVSAYDYGAMTRGEARLVWRTKLSAPDNSGSMDEVLVSLLGSGGPFFGLDLPHPRGIDAPLLVPTAVADTTAVSASSLPPGLAAAVDVNWLRALIQNEHLRFSGEYRARDESEFNRKPASSGPGRPGGSIQLGQEREQLISGSESKTAGLPPDLTRRITAYFTEKFKLQDALAAKIKSGDASGNASATIDEFMKINADRIDGLVKERNAIRGELARFEAGRSNPSGNEPLAAILRAFAADVQLLDTTSRTDG